jgi:NADH-quinone oxidoreductase subunit G
LADLSAGRHSFADQLKGERPLVIVGQGALGRPDGAALLAAAAGFARSIGAVTDGWNGFAVLHTAAARVGGLDLGFVPGEGGQTAGQMAAGGVDVLFNLGADEIEIAPGPFVIYQGTHGDRGAHRADVILPGAAYSEKSGTYVNTEGRAQMGNRATFPPGDAREDWAILRALSDGLGKRLPFDNLPALRRLMYEAHPHLAQLEAVTPADGAAALSALAALGGVPSREPFVSPVRDFFLTNPIARASRVMAECSALHTGSPALQAAE